MKQYNMVCKTFERFLRYQTGMGYEDFYNLYSLKESEPMIKEMFGEWLKLEEPSVGLVIVAKHNLEEFGWEV